jgi:hypothetical protein
MAIMTRAKRLTLKRTRKALKRKRLAKLGAHRGITMHNFYSWQQKRDNAQAIKDMEKQELRGIKAQIETSYHMVPTAKPKRIGFIRKILGGGKA